MKPTTDELIKQGCSCNAGQSCQRCDRLQGRLDVLEANIIFWKKLQLFKIPIVCDICKKIVVLLGKKYQKMDEEIAKIKEVLK